MEYKSPDNRDRRDAVERKFEKLAEAMVDIADQLLKHERGRSPSGHKGKVRALHDEGILDDRLTQAVLDALQNSLQRYVDFAAAVDDHLGE